MLLRAVCNLEFMNDLFLGSSLILWDHGWHWIVETIGSRTEGRQVLVYKEGCAVMTGSFKKPEVGCDFVSYNESSFSTSPPCAWKSYWPLWMKTRKPQEPHSDDLHTVLCQKGGETGLKREKLERKERRTWVLLQSVGNGILKWVYFLFCKKQSQNPCLLSPSPVSFMNFLKCPQLWGFKIFFCTKINISFDCIFCPQCVVPFCRNSSRTGICGQGERWNPIIAVNSKETQSQILGKCKSKTD